MSAVATWPGRAESWLDSQGKGAWIVAMVLGFIAYWPIGLAILAYMIWSKRMFTNGCSHRSQRMNSGASRPSGNAAFDSYKADMLRRLEDEQAAFDSFLKRLREAKDKSEFDAFMEERSRKRREDAASAEA